MMLKYSQDPSIREINPKLNTSRKWQASQAAGAAEEADKLKEVIGVTQMGKHGLGFDKKNRVWWSKASDKEKRRLVISEVREDIEGKRVQAAVQQGQQSQWAAWE